MSIAYVDGKITPIEEAVVPVEDRGLQFADGVYEVARIYNGSLFQLEPHLARMRQGLQALEIPVPQTPAGLEALAADLREKAGVTEGLLYLQVTRGWAPRAHVPPPDIRSRLMMTCRSLGNFSRDRFDTGVAAITHRDVRWEWCHIKATALVPNVILRTRANRAGAYECILHRDGVVTEATASNIFAVIDGVLRTMPVCDHILAGVTRQVTIELAHDCGIAVSQEPFSFDEARRAQELMLTGTTTEVQPVISLDGKAVGDGKPGPIGRQLVDAYARLVRRQTGN